MSTANLGIVLVAESQSHKEIPINNGFIILDGALSVKLDVSMVNNVTLSQTQAAPVYLLKLTGAQAAGRTLTLPSKAHAYLVQNACTGGFNTTILCGGGSTVAIPNGEFVYLYCDGTNVIAAGATAATVAAPGAGPAFVDAGAVGADVVPSVGDGVNLIFVLPDTPNPPESLEFMVAGVEQKWGLQYTLLVDTVTFVAGKAPPLNADVWARFRK
jgi:hypothetical protein